MRDPEIEGEWVLNGAGEDVPGHRVLAGTDLEIAYNLSGGDLVLRVNKGPCQIFRVRLVDALRAMDDRALLDFNSVSPDFVFKVGDSKARMLDLARSVGLDAEQLRRLEQRLDELAIR
jgi:hypothetical protein